MNWHCSSIVFPAKLKEYYMARRPDVVEAKKEQIQGAGRALAASQGLTPGPVHVNLPYRKPLEPVHVHVDEVPHPLQEPVA